MATRNGLEPSTSSVTGWHSNQLNYRAIFLSKDSGRCNLSWQGQKDSNPRHSVLETDALPAELIVRTAWTILSCIAGFVKYYFAFFSVQEGEKFPLFH